MDLKVLLSIPPDYEYSVPPLGTPAISAFLKKNGIDCAQIDLNLGYRDFLIRGIKGEVPLSIPEKRFFLKPALKKFFAERLEGRYYSGFFPRDNDGIFTDLPYDNNTNSSFFFGERLISSGYLWRYLEDARENTFLQFYQDAGILDILKKGDIGLFGISIISPSQAIASLTLGLFIKKNLPDIHVTIGGQWATLYRRAIMQKKELFRCFDSLVAFEGESALYQLVSALRKKAPLSTVPNIILSSTVSDVSADRLEEEMDLLPCPDFDGLNLPEYESNSDGKMAVTFETSRGCYWGKCAYCVDLPLPKPLYRRKDPRLVVNDMKELSDKYGVSYLFFGDPGLSPRQMGEISRAIIDAGLKIEW